MKNHLQVREYLQTLPRADKGFAHYVFHVCICYLQLTLCLKGARMNVFALCSKDINTLSFYQSSPCNNCPHENFKGTSLEDLKTWTQFLGCFFWMIWSDLLMQMHCRYYRDVTSSTGSLRLYKCNIRSHDGKILDIILKSFCSSV